ncbi:MAG TPA: DUF2304 domain-containing protein [Flavitalea sp.]|nr:DUF2304 domain-containing protein [Flavitalea sp.]
MTGIQIVLLTAVVFISLLFITRLRRRVLDIVILGVLVITAVVFILHPDLTNRIAAKLGVGRGADLVFYTSIMLFWFLILKLYARLRQLEQHFTEYIRKDALENAVTLGHNTTAKNDPHAVT